MNCAECKRGCEITCQDLQRKIEELERSESSLILELRLTKEYVDLQKKMIESQNQLIETLLPKPFAYSVPNDVGVVYGSGGLKPCSTYHPYPNLK